MKPKERTAVKCKEKQMLKPVSVGFRKNGLDQYPHWVHFFARKRVKNVVSPREWGVETLSTGHITDESMYIAAVLTSEVQKWRKNANNPSLVT